VPPKDDAEQLLAALRHNFQKIEQSLYTQLAKTPEGSLNDVRRSFLATAKGTQKRLKAWQKKHLGVSKSKVVGELVAEEPEWWGKGCHAVPGANIIVRENDWGSIIAHTLK
jgi:1-phosphatidylinositol-3-phosphate 5-kinase